MMSQQAQGLAKWKEAQKEKRRVQIIPQTETQEYLSMQELEFLMDCIGAFSAVLVIGGILFLAAYWFSPWVIPAIGGLTVSGICWSKYKRLW